MELTEKEQAILDGKEGPVLQKLMRSVVDYGNMFGATRLADIDHGGHFLMSMGLGFIKPIYDMLDEIIGAGLKCDRPFTMNPRPRDVKYFKVNPLQNLVFSILYKKQGYLESQLRAIGLRDPDAFSCTCYLPEVGNCPRQGAILAWSESSAVVYANSVLGARTNRNSGGIDFFMNVLGKTPVFDLLTDEGRKATWNIDVRCTKRPNAQLLGSAIGMKVMGDVPYITGLDKFLGNDLNGEVTGYLKDLGAASASNGAVGLYHVENLTPEAKAAGKKLLVQGFKTYIIDDAELDRIYQAYPVMWHRKSPSICFIGCPHLNIQQLNDWTNRLHAALGGNKVKVKTVFLAAPPVVAAFKKQGEIYEKFLEIGAILTSICPIMHLANPLVSPAVVTSSNKLRTYTDARFFLDDDLLPIIVSGKIGGEK